MNVSGVQAPSHWDSQWESQNQERYGLCVHQGASLSTDTVNDTLEDRQLGVD